MSSLRVVSLTEEPTLGRTRVRAPRDVPLGVQAGQLIAMASSRDPRLTGHVHQVVRRAEAGIVP